MQVSILGEALYSYTRAHNKVEILDAQRRILEPFEAFLYTCRAEEKCIVAHKNNCTNKLRH